MLALPSFVMQSLHQPAKHEAQHAECDALQEASQAANCSLPAQREYVEATAIGRSGASQSVFHNRLLRKVALVVIKLR